MNISFAEQRTILLYMLGGDLEADSGAATGDIMEILRTTKESSIHVVAYLGGSEVWWLPGLENRHCYVIEIQQGCIEILQDFGRQPSANEEQFTLFLNEYGNNANDLLFWGHGFPGYTGVGLDALANNDTLTLEEIRNSIDSCGLHFRLIGFDACEMASIEAAWLLSPYADWFAASSQIESLSGWDYKATIQCLSDTDNGAPAKLRKTGLQGTKRNQSVLPLTVIDEKMLLSSAPYLCRVLNSTMSSGEQVSLNLLAASSPDREAGDAVLGMLDGQILMLSNPNSDTSISLPGIQQSYNAFLNRR